LCNFKDASKMLKAIKTVGASQLNRRVDQTNLTVTVDKIDPQFQLKDPFLCDYQIDWVSRKNRSGTIEVWEKSRQVGASFTLALIFVLEAVEDKRDCIYTSYNKDASKQFIKDCIKWLRVLNLIGQIVSKTQFVNESKINVFEITLTNRRTITATAGNSLNMRGKPGCAIAIDEAAYREESLEDILAAASGTLIHGGWIIIASTHAGKDADFNTMVRAVRSGLLDYNIVKITFREAVKQGLFKRICLKQQVVWTQELEDEFVEKIYRRYGLRASEELDVIPGDFTGGDKVFNPTMFKKEKFISTDDMVYFRYYDLASSKAASAYYSANVKLALNHNDNTLTIVDYFAEQLDPVAGDNKIEETVKKDPYNTLHIIEIEPGSSGIKYFEYMKKRLEGFQVYGYKPGLNKLQRALPVASAIELGNVKIAKHLFIDDEHGNEISPFIEIVRKFSGEPKILVNDLVDCLSGAYDYWRQTYTGALSRYDRMYGQMADDELVDNDSLSVLDKELAHMYL
jgi:phage terminase large subunit-like protein